MEEIRGGQLRVIDAGLACCALEYSSATIAEQAWAQLHARPTQTAPFDVLIVTGTMTKALVPVIADARAHLSPNSVVISFGACSTSGGPYWDSYAVEAGITADIHVPGCPPPPAAVFTALEQAAALVTSRVG